MKKVVLGLFLIALAHFIGNEVLSPNPVNWIIITYVLITSAVIGLLGIFVIASTIGKYLKKRNEEDERYWFNHDKQIKHISRNN